MSEQKKSRWSKLHNKLFQNVDYNHDDQYPASTELD